MKLLRTFPKDAFEFGLASWWWLGLREQTPRFATCFGDMFLESLDGWWFLDTVEGTLELRWTSAVTMYAELESAQGRATYLMDDLVRDAGSRGIHLGDEDVYTFNPHPALGGDLSVNGLGTMRFELAINWVGQMHDRVQNDSGEISLPPMPDDGRRSVAAPVAAAWDSAWSEDETFDVPFEHYLATGTFAAVAGPQNDGRYPSLPPSPGRKQDRAGHVPYAAQSPDAQVYGSHDHESPAAAALPDPVQPWLGQDRSAQPWSRQTQAAPPWPQPSPAPRPVHPPEGYEAPYDPSYPAAPEQYEADAEEQRAREPYAQESWLPYDADQYNGRQDQQHDQGGSTWGNPTWGAPTWGGLPPTVAAGGNPQQAARTDDPFTAWDDLWGEH